MSLFRTLALALVVCGWSDFFGFYSAVSGFIHSLLFIAAVFIVVDLITSRGRAVRR
jgi:hypothetical protein